MISHDNDIMSEYRFYKSYLRDIIDLETDSNDAVT